MCKGLMTAFLVYFDFNLHNLKFYSAVSALFCLNNLKSWNLKSSQALQQQMTEYMAPRFDPIAGLKNQNYQTS